MVVILELSTNSRPEENRWISEEQKIFKVDSGLVLKLLQKCPSCEVIHFYRRATLKRESRMQALNLPWCWASHLQ